MKKINRRTFFRYAAASAGAALLTAESVAAGRSLKSDPTPGFNADVEFEFTARYADVNILKNGPATRVQKYDAKLLKGPANTLLQLPNNYLGPILNYRQGQRVRIYFYNRLDQPSIVHWHGLHVPQISDGHPMYAIAPGQRYVYEFEVKNRAGTNFYHSHTHEKTATQVYQGLAGLIKITDDEEQRLELPSGEYDIPLVIQDRTFTSRNQLQYIRRMPDRIMGFLGDTILVNGKPNIEFSVKTRAYRFRALNGSNSRIYKLGWGDGSPITAIGTDGGLLEKPQTRPYIMLAPGERVDLWLDFSAYAVGDAPILYSLAHSGTMPAMYQRMHGGMGNMRGGMGMGSQLRQGDRFPIATFKIAQKVSDSPKLPTSLVKFTRLQSRDADNEHQPIPIALSMRPMAPRLNGLSFAMDRVIDLEKVPLNSIKKIRIYHNNQHHRMGMMLAMAHPIHLHGQQYQILSRTMTNAQNSAYASVKDGFIDNGWKDTVLVMPGEEVHIIKPFQDFPGLYLYHCHNLEHEDLGMMRQFYIS